MMTQQLTPRTMTITTTTTTTTTTTGIAPIIPANNYDLRLTHQKMGTDPDVADEEEEEEMLRLEFLRFVEDDDAVQISTQLSLAYSIQSSPDRSLSSLVTDDHAVGTPFELQSDERSESESENVGEDDGGGERCLGERPERIVHFQRRIDDDDEQVEASASSSSNNPSTAAATLVPVKTDDVNVMVAHDHNPRQEDGEESQDKTDGIAQEVSPFHPLDRPPSPPPQQQQQQQQSDRIRWRLSTNYPPTRRRGERRAVTASGILATSASGATNSIFGDTTDSTSLRSSMIAPTTFVMVDIDGNQILTDPYTSSVTPPLPSPLSAAIMGGGGGSSSEGGKALPAPVPLRFANAIPRYHFTGNSNSSSSGSSSNGVVSQTADPHVAAHIAEALQMYGIPSLHQPTTVHPFQRYSMIPSTPSRSTSLGTSTTGGGGYEPPRGSTFPRLMHRSPSRGSRNTRSSSPSRVARVWAALTRRGVSSTTNTTMTTNTTIGSSRATTMVASSTTHSRLSQLAQPSSSPSASSTTLQYEQLPFVQQPRRPTIVLPSPLTRVSVVLGSGSTAGSSVAAVSSSVTGGCGNFDGGGNDGDGNEDGADDGDGEGNHDGAGEQQQQLQTRSMLQNANPEDKDQAAAGEPSAFQAFLKVLMCGC
ncbi:hypothetical protein KI688_012097 [Linnemannia hyalina]|uniref:Uncharacterized protein n=1 Tax=Linnemannia hyalina TaxID=64524 RepID=A0A9P8BSN3_9FUNG|nr:hypothetical protein KI688_012097 [Linnemannia hyalina]